MQFRLYLRRAIDPATDEDDDMKRLIVLLTVVTACSPATIRRELVERSNSMRPEPVDAVKQIQSTTQGGSGAAPPVDVPSNLPVASRGFLSGIAPREKFTLFESNIPGACTSNEARSQNCLSRYDGIVVAPKKKATGMNAQTR